MRSFTITEEPIEPVMFRRLHQEAQVMEKSGNTVLAYIENGRKIVVFNTPEIIKGMAAILTVPFRLLNGEELGHTVDIFAGMVS